LFVSRLSINIDRRIIRVDTTYVTTMIDGTAIASEYVSDPQLFI